MRIVLVSKCAFRFILFLLVINEIQFNNFVTAVCDVELKFVSSDFYSYDEFGWSVAVSGVNALVGSREDFPGTSGSVHVYNRVSLGVWNEVQSLSPTLSPADYFGYAVDIDGANAIIGALGDDELFDLSGAAYIFVETVPGTTWVEEQKLLADDAASGDQFGNAVSIDGNTAVVASMFNALSLGAIYVFSESSPGNWIQVQKLLGFNGVAGDEFGHAVSISGINIIVGIPRKNTFKGMVNMFTEGTSGTWALSAGFIAALPLDPNMEAQFGHSVGIDGANAVIGAKAVNYYGVDGGYAFVYHEVSPGSWDRIDTLFPFDAGAFDEFGHSVDISGVNIVVGAVGKFDGGYNAGAVYVFTEGPPGVWNQTAKLIGDGVTGGVFYGHDVSVSHAVVLVGTLQDSGHAYIYENTLSMCDSSPCLNGGICWKNVACGSAESGACDCTLTNYYGFFCQIPCQNGGVNDPMGTCDCSGTNAYGDACENLCQNNGTAAGSNCDCTGLEYYGTACDIPCLNSGIADTADNWESCNCTGTGFFGTNCNDLDDCASTPCMYGGVCTDVGLFEFVCNCSETFYEGEFCQTEIDECASSPCLHNGVCTDLLGNYSCDCNDTGYEGMICETELDECASSPCLHNGVCIDLLKDFTCDCNDTGYEGMICETEIDECASSPCLHFGICTDVLKGFTCDCFATGYKGVVCEIEIDECTSSPCDNGGACIDQFRDYSCNCNGTGNEGPTCNKDIDDCLSSPCRNGGTCTDTGANLIECTCHEYWEGTICTDNVDDCVTNACQNEAICVDGLFGNYSCNCTVPGYEGEFCDIDIDDCASSPCEHGSPCFDLLGDFLCDCTDIPYQGDLCEIYVPCFDMNCLNGGTCDNDICICPFEYTGAYCETLIPVVIEEEEEEEVFEEIVIEISIESFTNDDETVESFALALPVLLAAAIPNTAPEDYTVIPLPDNNTVVYEVTITPTTYLDIDDIIDLLEDPSVAFADRVDGNVDVAIPNQAEEEDEEPESDTNDLSVLLLIVYALGGAVFLSGAYLAFRYMNRRKTYLGTFHVDKKNIPL